MAAEACLSVPFPRRPRQWALLLLLLSLRLWPSEAALSPKDAEAFAAVMGAVRSTKPPSPSGIPWAASQDPCGDPLPGINVCCGVPRGQQNAAEPQQRITCLSIAGKNYTGSLHPAVANMTALKSLALTATSISGELPSLTALTRLALLDVHGSNFSGGFPELSPTANLSMLDLSSNRFRGSIPESISLLTAATKISLSHNRFSGPIPDVFDTTGVNGLVFRFNVSKNNLTGEIPPTLGKLLPLNRRKSGGTPRAKIQVSIDVSGNGLAGPIPGSFLNAKGAVVLRPGNQGLCGGFGYAACPPPPPAPPPSSGEGAGGMPGYVIGIAVGAAVACALLGVLCFWVHLKRRRKRQVAADNKGPRPNTLTRVVADGLIEFTYAELETATRSFHFSRLLGRGGFGHVYRGTLEDGFEVAVKMLNKPPAGCTAAAGEGGGVQGEAEYRVEIEVIGHVHHRNLVQLVGFCCEGESHRLLVYEFIAGGTLGARLRDEANVLGWESRMKIAVGAAKGLHYLHEDCEPRIVHRDIKPANILLDGDTDDAKIADFGLAKIVPDGVDVNMTTRVLGTWGYVAPEYVSSERVGTPADVFSFGVVLLEILSGLSPHANVDLMEQILSGLSPHANVDLMEQAEAAASKKEYGAFVDAKLGDQYVEEEFERALRVALMCLDYNPEHRPSMGEIVKLLTSTGQSNEGLLGAWPRGPNGGNPEEEVVEIGGGARGGEGGLEEDEEPMAEEHTDFDISFVALC